MKAKRSVCWRCMKDAADKLQYAMEKSADPAARITQDFVTFEARELAYWIGEYGRSGGRRDVLKYIQLVKKGVGAKC